MTKDSLDGDSIFVIRNFASSAECDAFVARSEQAGYEEATITAAVGFVMNKDVRDNARLILDDPQLAAHLWERAEPFLPRHWGTGGRRASMNDFVSTAIIPARSSHPMAMASSVATTASRAR